MKKVLILLLLAICISTYAQNKHFTLGIEDNGLCFGNSKSTNGIRLNLVDKDVKTINGINATLLNNAERSNGISLTLMSMSDSTLATSNGILLNGLFGYNYKTNGIGLGVLGCRAEKFNGLGVGGLALTGDTLNGLFASLFGTTYWNTEKIKNINGMAIGLFFGANTDKLNGVAIGGQNYIGRQSGITIGVVNSAEELHGFQFGLWNIAKNKKFLRKMPLINFTFRKKDKKKQ